MTSWLGLTVRSEAYWASFDPAFLFLTGSVLCPIEILLVPLGLFQLATSDRKPAHWLLVIGLVAGPTVVAIAATPARPDQMMFVALVAALLSGYGAALLTDQYHRRIKSTDVVDPRRDRTAASRVR
jgi:hypothetical protein